MISLTVLVVGCEDQRRRIMRNGQSQAEAAFQPEETFEGWLYRLCIFRAAFYRILKF